MQQPSPYKGAILSQHKQAWKFVNIQSKNTANISPSSPYNVVVCINSNPNFYVVINIVGGGGVEGKLFLQLALTYLTTAFQQCRNYMPFTNSLQI